LGGILKSQQGPRPPLAPLSPSLDGSLLHKSSAKLNTNGSVLSNPVKATAYSVMRDNDGKWIRWFSRSVCYITTTLVAELWGLLDVIDLANSLSIRKIIVEINAKSTMDILNSANELTVYKLASVYFKV
jgi:hypothetical protein